MRTIGKRILVVLTLLGPVLLIPACGGKSTTNAQNVFQVSQQTGSGGVPIIWAAAGGPSSSLAPQTIAFAPSNPSVAYLASSRGMFRSTDAGATWTAAAVGLDVFVMGIEIVVHPTDPNQAWVGTGSGVYRTIDGGTTWTPAGHATYQDNMWLVRGSRAAPTRLLATGIGGAFRTSSDSGDTWTDAMTGLPSVPGNFVFDPSAGTRAYATAGGAGVFVSTNGGGTWAASNTGLTDLNTGDIACDPGTPGTLYVTTLSAIFKSVDSGVNWAPIPGTGLPGSTANILLVDPLAPTVLYAINGGDVYRSVNTGANFSPAATGLNAGVTTVVAANGATLLAISQGLFRSTNGGASWVPVTGGLSTARVTAIAFAPGAVWAGANLGDGVYRSTDGGATWSVMSTGLTSTEIRCLAVDPVTPANLYVGTISGGVFATVNGGTSWAPASTGIGAEIRTLAIDPATPTTLYAGDTGAGIHKSINSGGTWTPLNGPGSGLNFTGCQSVVVDPSQPQRVYALHATPGNTGIQAAKREFAGFLHKSTDGGTLWHHSSAGVGYQYFTVIALDPANTSRIYGCTPGGAVYRSTDAALTWELRGAIPGATGLAVSFTNGDRLYAATGAGMMTSIDGGIQWARSSTGLPQVELVALALEQGPPERVWIGTVGRGIFIGTPQ